MSAQALARAGSALLLGLLITLLLMLAMQGLILRETGDAITAPELRLLDFIPRVSEQTPETTRPEPPRPIPPPPPPAPPQVHAPPPRIALEAPGQVQLDLPDIRQPLPLRLNLDLQPDVSTPPVTPLPDATPATSLSDQDVQPLVRVEPLYPRSARRRGIEGTVLVEFTVTRDGSTRDVRVVESEPPGVFDDAAVSAARQFRFQPRIEGGQPVAAPGIRNRITFRLE